MFSSFQAYACLKLIEYHLEATIFITNVCGTQKSFTAFSLNNSKWFDKSFLQYCVTYRSTKIISRPARVISSPPCASVSQSTSNYWTLLPCCYAYKIHRIVFQTSCWSWSKYTSKRSQLSCLDAGDKKIYVTTHTVSASPLRLFNVNEPSRLVSRMHYVHVSDYLNTYVYIHDTIYE